MAKKTVWSCYATECSKPDVATVDESLPVGWIALTFYTSMRRDGEYSGTSLVHVCSIDCAMTTIKERDRSARAQRPMLLVTSMSVSITEPGGGSS